MRWSALLQHSHAAHPPRHPLEELALPSAHVSAADVDGAGPKMVRDEAASAHLSLDDAGHGRDGPPSRGASVASVGGLDLSRRLVIAVEPDQSASGSELVEHRLGLLSRAPPAARDVKAAPGDVVKLPRQARERPPERRRERDPLGPREFGRAPGGRSSRVADTGPDRQRNKQRADADIHRAGRWVPNTHIGEPTRRSGMRQFRGRPA